MSRRKTTRRSVYSYNPSMATLRYHMDITFRSRVVNKIDQVIEIFLPNQLNFLAKHSPLASARQCLYDPQPDGPEYWLAGADIDCPLVDCGPPPILAGGLAAIYMQIFTITTSPRKKTQTLSFTSLWAKIQYLTHGQVLIFLLYPLLRCLL